MVEDIMAIIDSDSRPFWEATKHNKLLIQYCSSCGNYQFYPRIICKHCLSDVKWVEASGEGIVYSYTIVEKAFYPYFKDKVPYIVALIELKEGPRMLSNVVGVNVNEVRIGMPVQAVFNETFGEYKLVQFTKK